MATAKKQFPLERITPLVDASELNKGKHVGKAHFDVNCLMCNVIFRVTEKQLKRRFCSRRCSYCSLATKHRGGDHFKRSGQLVGCGKRTWVKQSKIDCGRGKYCSRQCYKQAHPLTLDPTKCCWYGKPRVFSLFAPYTDRLGRSHRFRSSYEIAFVEQYLDANGLTWSYEPQTFDVGSFTYTPDFWIEEQQRFIEVKGYMRPKAREKIELFKKLNPGTSLVVATKDMLQKHFELDLSKEAINDIHERFNAKTYVRRDQREAA